MADTMRRRSNTRNSSTNYRNFRSIVTQPCVFTGRFGRKELVREPLEDLEEENERVEDGIDETWVRSHDCDN
jgi:hypothetical protein